MLPKFMSSVIRMSSTSPLASRSSGDAFWNGLRKNIKRSSALVVPVCVLAEHFISCPVVTEAEREAHIECALCNSAVSYETD